MASIEPKSIPDWQLKLLNPVMSTLIKRAVGSLSREMMIINWQGRRSGRQFATPVSRFDAADGAVFATTPSGFQQNFTHGWPAQLQLGRELIDVTGTRVSDPTEIATRMLGVIEDLGLKRGARNLGIDMSERPPVHELAAFVEATGWSVLDFTRET